MSAPHASPGGPLSGVRVLDLSAYIAGPYGCALLADQGADVVKIEPPAGDNLRKYPSTLASESRAFLGVNRGKRGVALDLKRQEGLEVLLALARTADVLVHNFRPSVPARLGIDYERLSALNPRLVYCAVSGYGETGPLKDKAGYDQVLQTMTGMCALQGKADGPPEIVYGSVVDYYASAMVAAGVASALYERERSGRGQFVGVSLLRSALALQSARLVWAEGEPRDIGRDMRSGGITGLHPTGDGYLYLSANTPHFWQALCARTGLDDLARDERYDTVRKRAQRRDEIVPRLRQALRRRGALEWEAVFGDEVPCAAVRGVEDMFDFPQVEAEGMMATYAHPVVGSYRGFAQAIKHERGRAGLRRAQRRGACRSRPFAAARGRAARARRAGRELKTGAAGPGFQRRASASSAARQACRGGTVSASRATARASTAARGGISASTRTLPKRSMAWRLPGDSGPLMTTPSTGIARRRSASRLSSVWLMVPRPLRAASTTGSPSRSIRSIIMCRSSIGTYSPPAPSTTSGARVAGGAIEAASTAAFSSDAAAHGDSGACSS